MINLSGGDKLFCISVYNRKAEREITNDMTALFEKLNLDRAEHQYVIGGDFNALHEAWGFRRTYVRGREQSRFLNYSRPNYGPQTQSFPISSP